MAILEEDVARVRLATDLVTVAGEHVALKKVGRRWMGICPFHAENSPSFSVNGEEGLFYCFGCQKKGDAITFVREIEHLDFVQAVESLAQRAGISIRYDNTAVSKERKHRSVLTVAMEKAVAWYHQRLLVSPDASAARAYLRERGYDGDLVRRFQIGWAPDAWDELSRALRLPTNVLTETGLGFVNRRGRAQDAFRARIVFPIFDVAGAPVAFGGRILPKADGPKYKNSSETTLYNKSRTLYGLNWAKSDVVNKNEVIVCEGYTDVIGFFQAGVPRAVATCGTALTEEHVRQLKSFASRVVLAYDADSAGQAAAERFYEWEKKLGIDIAVAVFPKGTDPVDAARRDPQLLRTAVERAQPFLEFRLDRALSESDLASVEGRARAGERCLGMIREHPNELVRDQYLMIVADRCHLPAGRLRQMLTSDATPSRQPVIDLRARRTQADGLPEIEMAALRAMVNELDDVRGLLYDLAPNGLDGIEEILFRSEGARRAFRALSNAATLRDAIARAEPDTSDLLSRLAVEQEYGNGPQEFFRLVETAASRAIASLERQVRVAPDDLARASAELEFLFSRVHELRRNEQSTEAASAVLGWLLGRLEPQS